MTPSPRPRAGVVSAVLLSLAVGLVLPGCFLDQGACVHGSTLYFCSDDTEDECRDFWCESWDYCGYFDGDSCEDIGFTDDMVSQTSFSEPRSPDWSWGTPSGGSSGSGKGACAYYDSSLNRVLCDERAGASSCSGKWLGSGTTCSDMRCTSNTDPNTCTVSGGSSGGTCTATYQGPTGDAQVYTQCASVWNYRCQQKNDSAADQNCLVYDSLEASVDCPYCP